MQKNNAMREAAADFKVVSAVRDVIYGYIAADVEGRFEAVAQTILDAATPREKAKTVTRGKASWKRAKDKKASGFKKPKKKKRLDIMLAIRRMYPYGEWERKTPAERKDILMKMTNIILYETSNSFTKLADTTNAATRAMQKLEGTYVKHGYARSGEGKRLIRSIVERAIAGVRQRTN